MATFEWNEIFQSIEGEAKYSGHPTIYIRFSRCNFKCAGFNNPGNITDDKGYAPLNFVPKDYNSIAELTPMEMGCDTQYAVNPCFSHMWNKSTEEEVAKKLIETLPHNSWVNPSTGLRTILSITGGEPTLQWKKLPALLNHPLLDDVEMLLIETNCAVPFKDKFIDDLNEWVANGDWNGLNRTVVWSNSPKLSVSGESWENAIRPEIAVRQNGVNDSEQYFKFVCGPFDEDFDEVEKAMAEYHNAGISKSTPVYIMPVACTEGQQQNVAADVADLCIQRGYIYCHRVHNTVYANAIGK